jgi:hypothetical protein
MKPLPADHLYLLHGFIVMPNVSAHQNGLLPQLLSAHLQRENGFALKT